MIEISNTELLNLKNSNSLVVGEVYHITNYGGTLQIYVGAISANEFDDESTTNNENIYVHYVVEDNVVDYMKDVKRRIEGYFDWSDNITGEVKDVYFENSRNLKVINSSDVYCSGEVSGVIRNSKNIYVSDCQVQIESCENIVVGKGSVVNLSGCNNLTIGENNKFSIDNIEGISVGDNNGNLKLNSYNIVWSGNFEINVTGENNFIGNGNQEINLVGDFNSVENSRYIELNGSFNSLRNSELIGMKEGVGNLVEDSYSIDIVKSNNSSISVKDLVVEGKTPFMSYKSDKNSDIKVVRNLVEPENLQSDNKARILDIDKQKFVGETGEDGLKNTNSFRLDRGIWVKKP